MALMNIKAVMKEPAIGDKPKGGIFKKKGAPSAKSSMLEKLKGK